MYCRLENFREINANVVTMQVLVGINAPEGLVAEQESSVNRTSTEQVTVQVTEQVRTLVLALSFLSRYTRTNLIIPVRSIC